MFSELNIQNWITCWCVLLMKKKGYEFEKEQGEGCGREKRGGTNGVIIISKNRSDLKERMQ